MHPDGLEILLYIVVALLYGGGSFLAKKFQKKTDEENQENQNKPSVFDEEDDTPTFDDIRESIQRKIRERTGKVMPQERPQPAQDQVQPAPKLSDVLGDFLEDIQVKPETVRIEKSEAIKQLEREKRELERKRKEAQRLAKLAQAKSSKEEGEIGDICYDTYGMHGDNRPELIASFKDPHALQNAFLYQEIMGTPVGLREDGEIRQSWKLS